MHIRGDSTSATDTAILLDSCSDTITFKDPSLLNDIHTSASTLTMHTNAGHTKINQKGSYGGVQGWVDVNGIANIMSIPVLKKLGFHITYDSDNGYFLVTNRENGESIKFYEDENGMPSIDGASPEAAKVFVQTVRQNYEGYTKKEVEKAILARKASGLVGCPSERDLKYLVSHHLSDCPVSADDITRSHTIFGPDPKGIRGKTTWTPPEHVTTDYVQIPRDFIKLHKYVALVADVMFVNNIPFLITMSRKIKFITVEHIPTRTAKQLSKGLKRVMRLYSRAGMIVQTILMDMEFDKTADHLMDSTVVNTSAAKEHVAEIERCICTTKERCRSIASTLPYNRLHKLIVTNLVYFAVLWLNAFPVKNGVSAEHSPRAIVVRTNLSWVKHCKVPFGALVETHDEPDPSNTMEGRTHQAIAVGPTGNFNGTHKFFCLTTGRILKRRKWTELPMPTSVIKLLNKWGEKTRREVYPHNVEFRNRNKLPYEWTAENDLDEILNDETPPVHLPEVPAEFPGVDLEDDTPGPALEEEVVNPNIVDANALANSGLPVAGLVTGTIDVDAAVPLAADTVSIDTNDDIDIEEVALPLPAPMEVFDVDTDDSNTDVNNGMITIEEEEEEEEDANPTTAVINNGVTDDSGHNGVTDDSGEEEEGTHSR